MNISDIRTPNRSWLIVGLVILGLLAGVIAYLWYQEEQRRKAALGAMVVAFQEQNYLNVFRAQVPVFVTNRHDGWVIDVEQFGVIPASVEYRLNLGKLNKGNFDWDEESRRMIVTIPAPVVGEPVIDIARAKLVNKGILVRGDVALELLKKNIQTARRQALAEAKNPQLIQLARQAARNAMVRNVSVPLQAAGYEDMEVMVRFADEPQPKPTYLDRSTPYNEAIAEARRRRAAEGR